MDGSSLDLALFVLRAAVGVVMLAHGVNHIFGGGGIEGTARWFTSLGMRPGLLHAWLASLAEVGAGILLLLGLLTPMAGAAVIGTMLVALITNHRGNGFFIFRPGEGWEYVMTLIACGFAISILGAGGRSLDHALDIFDPPAATGLWLAVAGAAGAIALLAGFSASSHTRRLMILTTTLGAYPKPEYVPITDWFTTDYSERGTIDYTTAFATQMAAAGDSEALFRRATAEVIDDQIDAGIDVVTDGEVRRENYVHYQCRQFDGFDFADLRPHNIRGTIETLLPSVTGPVGYRDATLVHDFTVAQSLSSRPVKVTLPGPMTIVDTTVDAYYRDARALGAALAAALNDQIRDLADAGCSHVQIDEPVMARRPEVAHDFGIEQLGRCFDGVPDEVTRTVHCCCGYPTRLDDRDYPKADQHAYLDLAPALDRAPIDEISIEDAHRPNDLASLLPLFRSTTVVLGVIAIADSRVERVETIVDRLAEAKRLLPEGRLVAAPDCGLGYLGRDLARAKLRALTSAAASANRRS